ncbi:protein of unknown function [Candidatus Methylomirabilis oxygeniifera]|uniref:Uncharacterized protein n=1 Tax=Methylomirabilis oxygeniifera TaxID=671143 RepID=D5MF77_METO1|nr:protein of unknown function [Candidatus Methylomirabilis oxyfera]
MRDKTPLCGSYAKIYVRSAWIRFARPSLSWPVENGPGFKSIFLDLVKRSGFKYRILKHSVALQTCFTFSPANAAAKQEV